MPNRDCGCIFHDGPHWLYENIRVMRQNLQILEQGLERGKTPLTLLAFGRQEEVRLANLENEMRTACQNTAETIEAYLERTGWPSDIYATYNRQREEINTATIAALDRISAEAKEQAYRQFGVAQLRERNQRNYDRTEAMPPLRCAGFLAMRLLWGVLRMLRTQAATPLRLVARLQ